MSYSVASECDTREDKTGNDDVKIRETSYSNLDSNIDVSYHITLI